METGTEIILSDVTNNFKKIVAVPLYFTYSLLVEQPSVKPIHMDNYI